MGNVYEISQEEAAEIKAYRKKCKRQVYRPKNVCSTA